LLERLSADMALRRICGWESAGEIPHESKFSRAFSEFAKAQVPRGLHEALIEETQKERLIGHISPRSSPSEFGFSSPLVAQGHAGQVDKPTADWRGAPWAGPFAKCSRSSP
jgi:hypothetical protein